MNDEMECACENVEEYLVSAIGKWQMIGYRCKTCGFQTVTTETYIPVEKVCPRCDKSFEGQPDMPGEYCGDCFSLNLEELAQEMGWGTDASA